MILDTTMIFLKLLCQNYKEGKIDYFTFCLHSKIKIAYLKENYYCVTNPEKKEKIQEIVKQCESIISLLTVNA